MVKQQKGERLSEAIMRETAEANALQSVQYNKEKDTATVIVTKAELGAIILAYRCAVGRKSSQQLEKIFMGDLPAALRAQDKVIAAYRRYFIK